MDAAYSQSPIPLLGHLIRPGRTWHSCRGSHWLLWRLLLSPPWPPTRNLSILLVHRHAPGPICAAEHVPHPFLVSETVLARATYFPSMLFIWSKTTETWSKTAWAVKDWLLQETRGSLWQKYKLTKISAMMVKSAHDRQLFPHLKIYAPVADSPRIQGECTPTCPDFPEPRTSEEAAMFTPGNIAPLFFLRQRKTPGRLQPFHLGFLKGAVVVPFLPQFSQWPRPEAGDCSSISLHNAQTNSHRTCKWKTSPTSIC